MIEKTWLVVALRIGVSYDSFWHYTPHDMNLIIDGYKRNQQQQMEYDNVMAYIHGRYMVDALLCTVGNMMSKKGATKLEYPKEPYNINPTEEKELTEEQKDIQVKALFANLERMKANFERAKEGGNK